MESSEMNSDISNNVTINGMLLLEHKNVCDDVNYTLFRQDDSNHPSRINILNIKKDKSNQKLFNTIKKTNNTKINKKR